jgi:hypothetical protein
MRFGTLHSTVRRALSFCAAIALSAPLAFGDPAQDLIAAISAGTTDSSQEAKAAAVAATQNAGPAGAAAVVPLGKLAAGPEFLVTKHARLSLVNIVDYACRPGADAEKLAVAAEMEKLLAPDMPESARRDALQLLGIVGSDANIPAMAALLKDATLFQDAAMGLARLKAPAASGALVTALKTADAAAQTEIITAIAARKDPVATGQALVDFAKANSKSPTGWDALEIVAGFGMPPNEVFLLPPNATPTEKVRYVNCYVKVGDALAGKNQAMGAENMYAKVLTLNPAPQQICAALAGLRDIGSTKLAASAISVLEQPGVHEVAEEVLTSSSAKGLDDKLSKAAGVTSGPTKATLLKILAARKYPNLSEVLAAAKSDGDAVVRMTAATLAGEAPAEADVEAAVNSSQPWFRGPAQAAYIKLADAKLAGGDAVGAVKMYETIVNGEGDQDFKVAALTGIGKAGQASSRELVKSFIDDPALGEAAGKATIDIIAAQGGDAAKDELLDIAENGKQAIASYAIEKLRPLGIGTDAIPQRKGFITNWKIVGPLPNDNGSAFGKSFFPEGQADLADISFDGKTVSWKDGMSDQVPATINLREFFNLGDVPAACYAATDIKVDAETPVVFLIGSNDGCEFFVNGQKLHETKEGRPLTIDQDKVEAKLAPGSNRIVIKVLQDGGAWEFVVRVTNPDGSPFDMTKHR